MDAQLAVQMMQLGISEETQKMLVGMWDVQREPHLYPKEVVDALNAVKPDDPVDIEKMYRFKGFVIFDWGPVGIRPDASAEAKEEWMEYWESSKEHPFA